jgi:hypothetical protein
MVLNGALQVYNSHINFLLDVACQRDILFFYLTSLISSSHMNGPLLRSSLTQTLAYPTSRLFMGYSRCERRGNQGEERIYLREKRKEKRLNIEKYVTLICQIRKETSIWLA